ncbi:cilia- and flagella-associated protein 221-like [Protopterus annectens]|uniref:cilia- and flagella-associated protein 221-like n=1 Tax=Protopterus annectens TaxID=7888 RepID=UPI001CFA0D86|nr:cilia- and flagella-associated protein 221-like [Protopterus annectens]
MALRRKRSCQGLKECKGVWETLNSSHTWGGTAVQCKAGPGTKRQIKEAVFQQKLRQDKMEEDSNQMRWQVHLGKPPLSTKKKRQILEERNIFEEEYKITRGDPIPEKEFPRGESQILFKRVLRNAGKLPNYEPTFDIYSNNLWNVRHCAFYRFQQAAWKVLIQCRVNSRLALLKQLIEDLKASLNEKKHRPGEENLAHISKSPVNEKECPLKLSLDNLKQFAFPSYTFPDSVDELAPNSLGPVPVKPLEVSIKMPSRFYNLKVPQHYKLMGYSPLSAYDSSTRYIPQNLARPLKKGAEDELVPAVPADKIHLGPNTQSEDFEEQHEDFSQSKTEKPTEKLMGPLTLTPPVALLKPPDYHPLHVFNPVPGLFARKQPLSYTETDIEFHLCPLPRYKVTRDCTGGSSIPSTQKQFLDHEDVIHGIMTWKKFPSASLSTELSNPLMTNTWLSQWCDPFGTDLLPVDVPPILYGLSDKEKENITGMDGNEKEQRVLLTPEMLTAEFPLLGGSVPQTEERKERAIEERDKKDRCVEQNLQSQNTLGAKAQAWLNEIRSVSHNKNLIPE